MKQVLLVEDDRWLGESYERVLGRSGFRVVRVPSGDKAMRAVEVSMPDCIVADVVLVDETIFTLLHELQSYDDTRIIPVILCTNLSKGLFDETRLHHYGVMMILEKSSLTPEQLIESVRECVQ